MAAPPPACMVSIVDAERQPRSARRPPRCWGCHAVSGPERPARLAAACSPAGPCARKIPARTSPARNAAPRCGSGRPPGRHPAYRSPRSAVCGHGVTAPESWRAAAMSRASSSASALFGALGPPLRAEAAAADGRAGPSKSPARVPPAPPRQSGSDEQRSQRARSRDVHRAAIGEQENHQQQDDQKADDAS